MALENWQFSELALRAKRLLPVAIGWELFVGLPYWAIALSVTSALALAFFLRDVAVIFHLDAVVPPAHSQSGPIKPGARQVARIRVAASIGLAVLAGFWTPFVFLVVTMYALSTTILRTNFPDLHGGSSYVRVGFSALVRAFVGRDRAHEVTHALRPRAVLLAAIAGLGTILAPPVPGPVRQQVAEIGVVSLFGAIRHSIDPPRQPAVQPASPHAGSGAATGPPSETSPPASPDLSTSPPTSGPFLSAECGTDRLSLPALAKSMVSAFEAQWSRLGGVVLGCPTGQVTVLPDGVAVLDFAGGETGPAALVASPGSPRASAVFSGWGRLALLQQDLSTGELADVFPEKATAGSDYQLFVLDHGCVLSVATYGGAVTTLDASTTRAVLTLAASIGGTISGVAESQNEGDTNVELDMDLNGAAVRLTLDDATDGVTVARGPVGYVGDTFQAHAGCPLAAAREVMSQS